MRFPGWAASLLAVALLAAAAAPAAADSYTWGYGYARQRGTSAAQGGLAAPDGPDSTTAPFVVPLPGESQSTPVVVGGRWYLWTYWDGGLRGALWSGTLGPGNRSGPGVAVVLPGQAGPVVAVPPGTAQTLAEPSDAAVSPDGRWVAFGAGDRLYWWPAGDASAGTWAEIAGPGAVQGNSTSPTFVHDGRAPGGWDVCDGNWDGGFACFATGEPGLPLPTATYQVEWTAAADGDGYTAITSSAAYAGAGDLYFGVASVHDPRVVALDPRSGAYRILGGGVIRAPVSAAVALDGGDLYATDADGAAYRFDATSGHLEAAYYPATAGVDIASPAVGGGSLYVLASGRTRLVRLDAATLEVDNTGPAGASAAAASAPTVAAVPGAPSEVLVATGDGDIRALVPASGGGFTPLATLRGAPGGTAYNYTAAVLDGADVLLWSNGAAAAWAGRAAEAAAPGGAVPVSRGGLQVYALGPRLTAVVRPSPATVGGGPGLLTVLAPPGATVTAAGAPWGPLTLAPVPSSGPPCPTPGPAAAGLGMFPPAGGTGTGCGALAGDLPALAAVTSTSAGPHPDFGGAPLAQWQAAGAAFVARQAELPLPSTAGAFAVAVTARLPGGDTASTTVWLTTACPSGVAPGADGRCLVPLAAAPDAWAQAGGAPPPDDRCPADVAPGRDGWTEQEYQLLCAPLRPWLVDPAVLGCPGNWWDQAAAAAGGGCAGRATPPS